MPSYSQDINFEMTKETGGHTTRKRNPWWDAAWDEFNKTCRHDGAWGWHYNYGKRGKYAGIKCMELTGPRGLKDKKCPGSTAAKFSKERHNGNPNKLTCTYPDYNHHNLTDFNAYNAVKGSPLDKIKNGYTSYYETSCKNQQLALERTGHTFATGTSGTACQSKNHGIAMCNQIGMPLDQCHYGSYNKYRDLCITEGAKNGQYNNQGGKIVFSFEHGFNPSGARGICTSAAALKEYSRRVHGSQLGQNIVGNSIISGRNLAAMNELHKQCTTTKTFNSQTGEIKDAPLHGIRCTHQSLVTMKKDYTDNEKTWNALEKKRKDDEARDARIAAEQKANREAAKRNAEKMNEIAKQQAAAQEAQRKEAARLAKAGEEANKLIAQTLTAQTDPTPTTKKLKNTKKPKKTKKKQKPKKKSKKHIYIAIAGAVFAIILLIVLFMPTGNNGKGNNGKGNSKLNNVKPK